MQSQSDIQYHTPPALVNFFRLRPELSWFLLCYVVMLTLIYTVRWSNRNAVNEDEFQRAPFEMVELKIPDQAKEAEPDIALEEEEEIVEEKKQMKFGDDSGHWDPALGTPPVPLYSSYPQYPASMKNSGIEGQIIMELGIDETGRLVYGKIAKSLHPVLDRVVLEWIQKQKFTPAYDGDGKAFRVKIYLPIRFKLD